MTRAFAALVAPATLAGGPRPYPSYKDPDLTVADKLEGSAFPVTAFSDSKGELGYSKEGAYASEDDLVEDIERYAR